MDDLPAAVEAYEAAVQVGPDNAFAHIQLAYAYLHSGRPQDAMRAFEQGLALDPTRVAAREALERLRAEQP